MTLHFLPTPRPGLTGWGVGVMGTVANNTNGLACTWANRNSGLNLRAIRATLVIIFMPLSQWRAPHNQPFPSIARP